MSHYDTLGVTRDADAATIKAAYRKLAQRYHPDMNQGEASAGAEAMFKEVARAYEVLGDEAARARYDATGEDREAPTLDVQARELLLNVFKAALEQDGDAVAQANAMLANGKAEMTAQRTELQRRLRRYEKRSGRIKVKKGDNLEQWIIDQHIADLKANLAKLDEAMRVRDAAAKLAENYEPERMDPPMGPTAGSVFGAPLVYFTSTGA